MRSMTTPLKAAACIALLHAAVITAPAMAQSGRGSGDGNPLLGRALFVRENCAICHGGRAGGGMAPNLRDSRPSENKVVDAVLRGRPTGMPSYRPRLSERDALHIAAYIKTLRRPEEPTITHWWEVPGAGERCTEVIHTDCNPAPAEGTTKR